MWCNMCIDPILRCFNNPEGWSYGDLLVGMVAELSNGVTV
jgi:hypothetical protein